MNRETFLRLLQRGLAGLPAAEIEDIAADYAAHFEEGRASGRSEADIATALGDPLILGRELRAESGLRRWEHEGNPTNTISALVALAGLAAVDILVLAPLLLVFAIIALVIGIAATGLALLGLIKVLLALFVWHGAPFSVILGRLLTGIGLVAGAVCAGSLLLGSLNLGVRFLGAHARLHYRLVKPNEQDF